jgi:hypothetical protein
LKRRKLQAETTIMKIETVKKRGEDGPIADMESTWRDVTLVFKTKLRLLSSKAAGQIAGVVNVNKSRVARRD